MQFFLFACNSTEMRFDWNAINTNLIAIKFKPISKNIFLTLLLTFHELRTIPMNTDKISDAAAVVQLENVIVLLWRSAIYQFSEFRSIIMIFIRCVNMSQFIWSYSGGSDLEYYNSIAKLAVDLITLWNVWNVLCLTPNELLARDIISEVNFNSN